MISGFISLGPDKLHYLRFGNGPKLVLAFHGYSNSAGLFLPFERWLERECTVISIDLPHHGRSTDWPAMRPMTPADFEELVRYFLTDHGVERCSLLAYSLGGRLCLKMIEQIPQLIDRVVLAAPDGLRFSPFYFFITRTAAGRGFFGDMLNRPQRYIRVLDTLKRRGMLSEIRHSFARNYLESSYSRGLLQKTWPSMRYLLPRISFVKAAIRKHNIAVHIFAGRHDRVIAVADATAFARGESNVKLHILEKGHRLLDDDTIQDMARALTD